MILSVASLVLWLPGNNAEGQETGAIYVSMGDETNLVGLLKGDEPRHPCIFVEDPFYNLT